MKKILICAVLVFACAHPRRVDDFALTPETREQAKREVLTQLKDKYVFADRASIAVAELEKRWSDSSFQEIARGQIFMERVNRDLAETLHDRHLFLRFAGDIPEDDYGDLFVPDAARDARREAFDRPSHFGIAQAEVLPGNLGYLRIDEFAAPTPGLDAAYAGALDFVRDTEALIIDLRDNGGGEAESASRLVSWLAEGDRVLLEETSRLFPDKPREFRMHPPAGRRYARDVYVLTGRKTFSAAEYFTLALRSLHRATVIGEPTPGGSHENMFVKIAGKFALSVPFAEAKLDGRAWEGTGVQPDVASDGEHALAAAQKLALEKELGAATDKRAKFRLMARLAQLEK